MAENVRLLVVGVDHNDAAADVWTDLPSSTSAARLAHLLERFAPSVEHTLGFPQPTRIQAEQSLRTWFRRDAGPLDNTLLYWVGHGSWGDGEFYLVTADSEAELDDWTSMSSGALAKFLKLDWTRRKPSGEAAPWTVAVLDCCSGKLGVEHIVRQFDVVDTPQDLGLVGGHDTTFAGSFVDALEDVLAGYDLNDREVRVRGLFEELAVQSRGRIHADVSRLTPHAVLINQLAGPSALVVSQVAATRLRQILADLPPERRNHFFAKAQGAELDEMAWHFQGRRDVSRRIASWVDSDSPGMLVVTGPPGCGKSALLGRLVTLSDATVLDELLAAGMITARPPGDELPTRPVDAAVHLTGKSVGDVVASLAEAVGLPGADLDALLAAVQARAVPLVVVVDALDEAQDPLGVAASLLRRLVSTGRVKMVVGTRRSLSEGVDQPDPAGRELVDALAPGDSDVLVLADEPEAIERYAYSRLTAPGAPWAADGPRAAHVAHRIRQCGQPFLFARLAAVEITARPERTDEELDQLLGGGHRRLFEAGLARFAASSDSAVPLLRALAYGLGRGLPRRDQVWVSVASALHPSLHLDVDDVSRVLTLAAPHIAHDGEAGQGTYRLAHRTYVELFEAEGLLHRRHRAIVDRLLAEGDRVGWANANPYLLRSTAAHARLGDRLDRVLAAPDLLDHHDQDRLSAELQARYFGAGDLEPIAGAILRVRGELARAAPPDRPALRRLAELLNDESSPTRDAPGPAAAWWPWWASSDSPLHLRLSGHTGQINAVAFGTFPDGHVVLASAGSQPDNTVRLWDPATGMPLGPALLGHTGSVNSLAFGTLPSGRLFLASASDDRTVRLWDPATGQAIGSPLPSPSVVMALAVGVGADGQAVLATANGDGTIRLWDPVTGWPLRPPLAAHTAAVTSVAFGTLADARLVLASASRDHTVRLWDLVSGAPIGAPLAGVGNAPEYLVFATLADKRVVLAVTTSSWHARTTQLVDPATGATVGAPVAGYSTFPHPAAFGTLANGQVVLSTPYDNEVRLWDPATGRPIGAPFTGHTNIVMSTALGTLSDGRVLLASAARDGTVRLWDPASRSPAGGPRGTVSCIAVGVLADGRQAVATVTADGTARLRDARTGRPLTKALTGAGAASGAGGHLAFATLADGRVVIAHALLGSASEPVTMRVWDTADGELIQETAVQGAPVAGFLNRPGGTLVMAGGDVDGTVRLWDVITGRALGPPVVLPAAWDSLIARADGTVVALAGAGEPTTMRLWDAMTGQPLGPPLTRPAQARSATLHSIAGGQLMLATIGADAVVRLWDPMTGRPVGRPLVGHVADVTSVNFVTVAEGQLVAVTGSADTTIRLWNYATGATVGGAALPGRVRVLTVAPTSGPDAIMAVRIDSAVAVIDFPIRRPRAS